MIRTLVTALVMLPLAAAAQVASPPQVIGTLAGPGSTPPDPNVAFFGTDLGWTVEHDGDCGSCSATPTTPSTRSAHALQRRLTGHAAPETARRRTAAHHGHEARRPDRAAAAHRDPQGRVAADGVRPGARLGVQRREEPGRIVDRGGTIRCKPGVSSPVAACRGPLSDLRRSRTGSRPTGCAARRRSASVCPRRTTSRPRERPRCRLHGAPGRDLPAHSGRRLRRPTSSQNNGTPASERFTAAGHRLRHRGSEQPRSLRLDGDLARNKFITRPRARSALHLLAIRERLPARQRGALVWGRPLWDGEQGRSRRST